MRRIDSKFHVDSGRIIKTSNGEEIPEDEPLFMFRARDRLALPTLRAYRELSIADGCNDWHTQKLDAAIHLFERFADEHPERMKQPSITKGA